MPVMWVSSLYVVHVYTCVLWIRFSSLFLYVGFDFSDAVNTGPNFTITHDLLQKHFTFLYQELEPRDIADQMFQACHISVSDHDAMTDDSKKFKRLKELLDILRRRNLYIPFLYVLHSLRYFTVLDTLQRDRKLKVKPCKSFLYIFLYIF